MNLRKSGEVTICRLPAKRRKQVHFHRAMRQVLDRRGQRPGPSPRPVLRHVAAEASGRRKKSFDEALLERAETLTKQTVQGVHAGENAGRWLEVPVSGSLVLNDMHLVLNAVLDGIGIGYISEHVISPRVADGQLVPLLGVGADISRELTCITRAVARCQAHCVHLLISCAPNPTSSVPHASKNRSMNRS